MLKSLTGSAAKLRWGAAVAAAATVALAAQTAASAATAKTTGPTAKSAVHLAATAGFANVNTDALVSVEAVTTVPVDAQMTIEIGGTNKAAVADVNNGVVINSPTSDGTITIVKANETGVGFGIVTGKHAKIEFRYSTKLAAGTTVKPASDGGLDHVTSTGKVIAHISPAYGIDSKGTKISASYTFDASTNELVVKADTTHAAGDVFIDPFWKLVWRLVWEGGKLVWKGFWIWCSFFCG